jgi:hypothetical protein
LPQCSPIHRGQQIEASARCLEQGGIIGMDHRLHEGDRIMPSEEGEARPDHRLAEDMPVLLGQIPARAQPAARCHDHGCDLPCHRFDPKNDCRILA